MSNQRTLVSAFKEIWLKLENSLNHRMMFTWIFKGLQSLIWMGLGFSKSV